MISFREITPDDAELIGTWRTSDRVTQYLNTDVEFNLENQVNWIYSSRNRSDYYHWLILNDGRPVGHIQITGIDLKTKSAEWGYFIGEEDSLGIGGHVPALLYSFCFKFLGLEELRVQCLHTNPRVIALHQAYGYHFKPELDYVVRKGDSEYLSIGMTLNRDDYLASRFSRSNEIFPVEMWVGNPFK